MADQFVARRTFQYGPGGAEQWLDRGQIFELQGLKNDAALVRLGYVSSAIKGVAIVGCGKCGAKFVTDEGLASHGRERHVNLRLTPEEEDKRAEQRLKKEDDIAPLDLTKTAASRGVRAASGR